MPPPLRHRTGWMPRAQLRYDASSCTSPKKVSLPETKPDPRDCIPGAGDVGEITSIVDDGTTDEEGLHMFDGITIDELRARGSVKWSRFPGAIGAFIAEMDFGTAPEVT